MSLCDFMKNKQWGKIRDTELKTLDTVAATIRESLQGLIPKIRYAALEGENIAVVDLVLKLTYAKNGSIQVEVVGDARIPVAPSCITVEVK